MEKPIVFLSHASNDRTQLSALKDLLDKRAVKSLNFFLSSDGQSIPFGQNWVVTIGDALKKAKLMFVFLSPGSSESKWVHFEAGHAYAMGLKVVPVCLPGMDFDSIKAPLSHLQGFNLHSPESMGNVVRVCNQNFNLGISETFAPEDFSTVFAKSISETDGFFGKFARFITGIRLNLGSSESEPRDVNPIPILAEVCRNAGVECKSYQRPPPYEGTYHEVAETPGCEISMQYDPNDERSIICGLSPKLFHVNAPLLDKWYAAAKFKEQYFVTISFQPHIMLEDYRPELTTRLLNSNIHVVNTTQFEFNGMGFSLLKGQGCKLLVRWDGHLHDNRLREIVERLFEFQIMSEGSVSAYLT